MAASPSRLLTVSPRGEIYDLLTTKPEDAANGKQTE